MTLFSEIKSLQNIGGLSVNGEVIETGAESPESAHGFLCGQRQMPTGWDGLLL